MAGLARLRVLDDGEIARIHRSSLEVLASTGVRMPHRRMLELFAEAGATLADGGSVRIPPELVESCLADAGRSFVLQGRDPGRRARFGFGDRNYNSIAGEALWLDHRSGERRAPTLADVRSAAVVGDAMGRIGMVGAMADPADVPVRVRCVEVARELLRSTTKPVTFWFYDRASAAYLVELAVAVAGSPEEAASHPPFYPFLEPVSPLAFTPNGVDLLFETARIPLPVPIGPMAQLGATAPGTIAGTLVQENAEILAGICVVELIRRGTPVCYGGIPHAHDMRTSQLVFSGPEQSLMAVAMAQMGSHYGLPVYINVGLTDAKVPDAQAGLEIGISLLGGMLSGADIFGHMGISGVDQAASLSMLALQEEAIDFLERLYRGFAVDEETLALPVIRDVGPGGNYLGHEHTVRHFREELWFPRILDRQYFDHWVGEGRRETAERCRERIDRILATHRPVEPEPALAREMDRIVAAARRELL